jgi:hypothetical protein
LGVERGGPREQAVGAQQERHRRNQAAHSSDVPEWRPRRDSRLSQTRGARPARGRNASSSAARRHACVPHGISLVQRLCRPVAPLLLE